MTFGLRFGVAMGLLIAACGGHAREADPPVERYEGSGDPVPVPTLGPKEKPRPRSVVDGEIAWRPFSRAAIAEAQAQERKVMVAVLADWSANAKVLAKEVLQAPTVLAVLEEERVVPILADFTNEDEAIESYITELGAAGVPLVGIYYRDGTIRTLDGAVTADMLATYLRAASRHR